MTDRVRPARSRRTSMPSRAFTASTSRSRSVAPRPATRPARRSRPRRSDVTRPGIQSTSRQVDAVRSADGTRHPALDPRATARPRRAVRPGRRPQVVLVGGTRSGVGARTTGSGGWTSRPAGAPSIARSSRRRPRPAWPTTRRPGLVAYDGETAVGWVSVGPREDYERLAHSRVLAPVDDTPVWSIVCFVVGRRGARPGRRARAPRRRHRLRPRPRRDDRRGVSGRGPGRRADRLRRRLQGHAVDVRTARLRGRRPAPAQQREPRSTDRPTDPVAASAPPSTSSVAVRPSSSDEVDTPCRAGLDCPPARKSRARITRQEAARMTTMHDSSRPTLCAQPVRRTREICAHLELAAGGRTAFRTDHEPWARSGPRLF